MAVVDRSGRAPRRGPPRGPGRRTVARLAALVLGLVLSPATALAGGSGAPLFSIGGGDALTGETVVRAVLFDPAGLDIAGWSLGVCHDAEALELVDVALGPQFLVAKNGAPPDFHLLQEQTGGFTSGVVICFTGCALLPPGNGQVLYEPSYLVTGLAPAAAAVAPCGTLATPVVPLLAVLPGGATVAASASPGEVAIVGPPPLRFRFGIGSAASLYDPGNGVAAVTVPVTLLEEATSAGAPNAIGGFTLPLGHDPVFATAVAALPGAELLLAGGGAGPDTFLAAVVPGGIVVSATLPLAPPWLAGAPREVALVEVESVPNTLAFNPFGVDIPLVLAPGVTAPPTAAAVISPASAPVGIAVDPGLIEFVPREGFRRGDANDDGLIDIGDAIALLGFLFSQGTLVCRDAGDGNDDGLIDIADAIALLGWFFAGGNPPPAPFPNCGFDPGAELGCTFHSACP